MVEQRADRQSEGTSLLGLNRLQAAKLVKTIQKENTTELLSAIKPMIIRLFMCGIVSHLLSRETLWITSKSGGTTRCLPLYTALRVVRKKGWSFTKVEPIRKVSRWEAFRIVVFGDGKKGVRGNERY